MITDHDAELRALVHAAVDRDGYGEPFGYLITSTVLPVQGGFRVQRQIVITLRSPLLGQPPLMHTFPAPFGLPDKVITAGITKGIQELRKAAATVLAQGNGKSHAGAK